jgi:hypothetical protein
MDCPECGTWNPDDKLRCWRCDAVLPIPEPLKTRRVDRQRWVLIAFIVVFALSTLVRCAISIGSDVDSLGWLCSSLL